MKIYAMLSVSPESVEFYAVTLEAKTIEHFDRDKGRMKDELKRPALEAVIARLQEELDKLP